MIHSKSMSLQPLHSSTAKVECEPQPFNSSTAANDVVSDAIDTVKMDIDAGPEGEREEDVLGEIEDQVVREIDVFYNPSIDDNAQNSLDIYLQIEDVSSDWHIHLFQQTFSSFMQLYVLQYPLRQCWRPYELDERCEQVLSSSSWTVPKCTGYVVGILMRNKTDPRILPLLTLNERLKIAVNVARYLNYLHNESAIPHGNLKSTNILLEGPDLHTLLSDYSLHRLLTSAGTAEQVLNAGALGYRPPEFCSTSKPCPSLKSDVYAFGVVILLELLTGKSSAEIVPVNTGALDLTEWARLLYTENRSAMCFHRNILECNIEGLPKGLDDMLLIALRCILPADERPDMKSVSEVLSFIALS